MKKFIYVTALLLVVGCENYTPSNRDVGAAAGATLGAGLGAVVGNQVGNAGEGVAVGAAAGALVGGLVGHSQDLQNTRLGSQDEVLRRQEQELQRQERELEELKRQRYQDGTLGSYTPSSSRTYRADNSLDSRDMELPSNSPGSTDSPYTYPAEPYQGDGYGSGSAYGSAPDSSYSAGAEYGSVGARDDYRY